MGRTADLTIKLFVAAYLYLARTLLEASPLSRKRRRTVKIPNHNRGGKTQKSTGTEVIRVTEPEQLQLPAPVVSLDPPPKFSRWKEIEKPKRKAGLIWIGDFKVQSQPGCTHGSHSGATSWMCQCPLCRAGTTAYREDQSAEVPEGWRRGLVATPVMIDPEKIPQDMLEFYATRPDGRIPRALRNYLDGTNGHHESPAYYDFDVEAYVTKEVSEETPIQEQDDITVIGFHGSTVQFSDGSTITVDKNSIIITRDNGVRIAVDVNHPSVNHSSSINST